MTLSRTTAILLRQVYLIRGSPARVVPLFVWVAIDIVLWGFFTRYLNSVAEPGFNFVPALLGAVLLWDFFTRVMQGVTLAFFEDVWARNLLNVFATPLSIPEYLAGLVLTSIATSAVGLLAMLAIATGVFGLSFFLYGLAVLPFLLVLFLFGSALGMVGCAMVLRFGPASEWFVWVMPALISPFAGVFYPITTLPAWMRPLSLALPPAHVFEALRAIVTGGPISFGRLLLGVVLALLYVGLAAGLFMRVHRHAVRTGLIARYSAESLN